MDCPRCARTLIDEGVCRSCPTCAAMFFTARQARDYFLLDDESEEPVRQSEAEVLLAREPSLPCPECLTTMDKVHVDDALVLDSCDHCRALFFDAGESLALRARLAQHISAPRLRRALRQMVGFSLGGPYR